MLMSRYYARGFGVSRRLSRVRFSAFLVLRTLDALLLARVLQLILSHIATCHCLYFSLTCNSFECSPETVALCSGVDGWTDNRDGIPMISLLRRFPFLKWMG